MLSSNYKKLDSETFFAIVIDKLDNKFQRSSIRGGYYAIPPIAELTNIIEQFTVFCDRGGKDLAEKLANRYYDLRSHDDDCLCNTCKMRIRW